jgi:hypothetical protein
MIDLGCGNKIVSGDTSLYTNTAEHYSCNTWLESGKEIVYRVYLDSGGDITAVFTIRLADLDLYILGACDERECLEYGSLSATARGLPAGYYFIVVDGYMGAEGEFELEINATCTYTPTPTTTPTPTPTPPPIPFYFNGWVWVDDPRIVSGTGPYSKGGDTRMYDHEIIPTSGWVVAPHFARINLDRPSRLTFCDYSLDKPDLNFQYFRTQFYISYMPTSAKLKFDTVDDGCKVVVNSSVAGYGFIGGGSGSIDILTYLRPNFCNEILVTVVDNCTRVVCLEDVRLYLDGTLVPFHPIDCDKPPDYTVTPSQPPSGVSFVSKTGDIFLIVMYSITIFLISQKIGRSIIPTS